MKNKSATVRTLIEILSELKNVPLDADGNLDVMETRKMPEVKAVITLVKFIGGNIDKYPVAQMLLGKIYEDGEIGQCVICKGQYTHFGNNPDPIEPEGRCCDSCNNDVVMARIEGVKQSYKEAVTK